jgi:integrase
VNVLSPSTTTIYVIVRHGTKCKREHPGLPQDHKDCNCRKSIYIYENGEDHPISAKTRSWGEAEKVAQAERDKRNPDKQEVAELKKQLAAKKEAEAARKEAEATKQTISIVDATQRWFDEKKAVSHNTAGGHLSVVGRIRAWAKDNNIETVAQVTANQLDQWRGKWSPRAEEQYNRIAPGTQKNFQFYLKDVFRYIVGLGDYIDKSPAEGLRAIKVPRPGVQPLSLLQFEDVLASIEPCCAAESGIMHEIAAELRALCLLQRYEGLRLGDAVALPRTALVGNLLTLKTQKTGVLIKDRFVPDQVVTALTALSKGRKYFREEFFLWPKSVGSWKSLVARWEDKLRRLNPFLNFINDLGEPMKFHSHLLRHTFAVQLLLLGVPIDEVSKLLTHDSVATTETYYASWVKARIDKMNADFVAATTGMGMTFTIGEGTVSAGGVNRVIEQFIDGLARTGNLSGESLLKVAERVKCLVGAAQCESGIQLSKTPSTEYPALKYVQ